MIHTRKIDEMNKHELVLLAINACNLLEDVFLIENEKEQEIFKNKHIENFERYVKKFVRILKKLNYDKYDIDETINAIKNKKDYIFPIIEDTLMYYFDDEIDFDNDEIIDFGLNPLDLSKFI